LRIELENSTWSETELNFKFKLFFLPYTISFGVRVGL
jgi:hypothetical protein